MGFWGLKKGWLPPGKNTPPPGTNLPPKHVFGYIERQATLLMVSCRCVEGTKRKYIFLSFFISLYKKVHMATTSPIPPHHAPFSIATNFGMWGHMADVINHANFVLDGIRFSVPKLVAVSKRKWSKGVATHAQTKNKVAASNFTARCTIDS